MPAAAHTEKDGSLHQHPAPAPVAPQGGRAAGRLPLASSSSCTTSGGSIRERAGRVDRGARPPAARPDLGLPDCTGRTREPDAGAVLREIGGLRCRGAGRRRLHASCSEDGSTSCGCWIYAGVYADGVNQAARRRPGARAELGGAGVGLGLAGEPAHPLQPRVRRPRGQAVVGAQGVRVVGRGGRAAGPGRTTRTSSPTSAPDYVPEEDARAAARRCAATSRSSCRPTGWAGCSRPPAGGRPAAHPLRAAGVAGREPALRAASATRRASDYQRPENPYNPTAGEPGSEVFPYVMTTYRLTEHHTAGGDDAHAPLPRPSSSRSSSARSPRSWRPSAASSTAGWATIVTARAAIEARVLVTERMEPLTVDGRDDPPDRPALPLGLEGLATGDVGERPASRSCSTRTSTSRR